MITDDILEDLITDQKQYDELYKELLKDREEVLPTLSYKGNCSKEYCEKIVDLYLDREFERIQSIDFPDTRESEISNNECYNEFVNLRKLDKYWKSPSPLIRKFHNSMMKASVGGEISPYEGWQMMKADKEKFKRFYFNRLRCSDWYNERGERYLKYLPIGYVPEFIYGIGLSTSRMYQQVTYFKPSLAKYLVRKYLNCYETVFDPFSGYSGRMIGVLACDKNYIGQDLCELSVNESKQIWDFLEPMCGANLIDEGLSCQLSIADTTKTTGTYECLLTCSPYEDIENWPGVVSVGYTCDKWIDICLNNFECQKYVFVTDGNITKYKPYVTEQLINTSHFSENTEYVVVIDRKERNKILKGEIAKLQKEEEKTEEKIISCDIPVKPFKIAFATRSKRFQEMSADLFNLFNKPVFDNKITAPEAFKPLIEMIYKKFKQKKPVITSPPFAEVELEEDNSSNEKVVVLAFSGGLDSCSQALLLKEKGYDVHLFHMSNANKYENGQGTKVGKLFAIKHNMKFIEAKLSNGDKAYPENPIKNQMIIGTIVDYLIDNGYNKIGLGEKEVLTIDEVVTGINVTDSKDVNDVFLEGLHKYVKNLEIIDVEGVPTKLDKLNVLEKYDSLDLYYSCLLAGRFNKSRHDMAEEKYGIKLPLYNCGCYCRKCATHILMWHYYGNKQYPQEFIDQCWKIMYDNGFSSEKRFFTPDIPLEQRIKNLLEQ